MTTTQKEVYRAAFPPGKTPHESPFISYHLPFPVACAKHVSESFHASRIYVLASASLCRNTDSLERLCRALGDDKVVGVRRGVRPHTYYSDILEVVKEAHDARADCLITLGGGSLSDCAKVATLALANEAKTLDELETLYFDSPTKRDPILPATVPIVCIPTSLSAGEYTPIAGATNNATHHKHSFQELSIGPRLIILDPELSIHTPANIWLSTGIRAVDHCVESICSIKATPEGDATAERGLRNLLPSLLVSKHEPANLQARLNCQLGAIYGIAAGLARVPMGASHGIGHQLGPLGVGHGETSCILLPAVMKWNSRVNSEKQQKVLDILWSEETIATVLKRRGLQEKADLGDVLDTIFRELNTPRTLKEVGIGRESLEALAEGSLNDRWCKTNPIPLVQKGQVLEILEMVIGD